MTLVFSIFTFKCHKLQNIWRLKKQFCSVSFVSDNNTKSFAYTRQLTYTFLNATRAHVSFFSKKGKRKVQGVPQSQTAAPPRPQEEEETDKSKQAQANKRTKSTKISSLFPKRGNRNTNRTKKHKKKMTHGKTYNKSPRRINHKATKSKTSTAWVKSLPEG